MTNALVVDYGLSNLGSVCRSLEECGANVSVLGEPTGLDSFSHVVLPGVGAFAQGMANLRNRGWDAAIRDLVLGHRVPLLGICLGMQLLAEKGLEGGPTEGLGLVPGTVEKLRPPAADIRIPHIGWNEIWMERPSALLDGITDRSDFYFVHSYQFAAADPSDVIATTPYCGGFASVVASDSVFGVQFHPEKSQKLGHQLLRNFLAS